MKKLKLQLPTNEWQDIRSNYAPDDSRFVDQNAFTSGTKNIDTEGDGTIRKMKGAVQFATLASTGADQYEAVFSDGTRHLLVVEGGILKYTSGEAAMTTVTSGYTASANFEFATTKNRIYFGNQITNQVYDKTASYGGVGYSVPQTKVMGCQIPGSAPTAALGAAGSNVPAGAHTYKVTFLYYGFQESNGSTASNLVTVTGANEQVDLTSIPIGGYGVTARKIYRDNNDGVYVLVGTLSDNTTTIFSDTVAGGTTPIPADNGIPPIFGQVKLFSDRLWMAQISGEPFTLYFSEAGLPDIVGSTNFIECNPEDPITGLYPYRGRLIVFNRRSMGQILGDTKDTFAYDSIEGSVGCVDNRSIQEITLNGVPVLIWLSDKGIYGFNGSSIFYLSESVEDVFKTNIKQTVIQRNQNVDTTNDDFNAGTASEGIDVAAGQVSIRGYQDGTSTVGNNPRRTWNDTADWDGGSSLDNVATIGLSNTMRPVEDFSEEPATEGTKDGVETNGVGVSIPLSTDFTGESSGTATYSLTAALFNPVISIAYPFIPDRTGTLDGITMRANVGWLLGGLPPVQYRIKIWEGPNIPTSTLYTSGLQTAPAGILPEANLSDVSVGSPTLTAGTKYWFGITAEQPGSNVTRIDVPASPAAQMSGGIPYVELGVTGWDIWTNHIVAIISPGGTTASYSYTSSAIAASGTWKSTVYDSQSTSANIDTVAHTTTIPAGTSTTTIVDAGDALDFAGNLIIDETESFTDLSGSTAVTLGARRYWQVTTTLTTDDDRTTPVVSTAVTLDFEQSGEWISDSIDTTGDSTVYNALTTASTTPGSSAVTVEIRTATTEGGLTAAPWVAFGSVTVRQWAQVRITMTKSGDDTASVSSSELTWTIVSNLISDEINTTVTPAGWDIFQTDFDTNGGTVVYEMRSAASSGALSGATWYTVTNGNFPTSSLPNLQYIQWRVTMTATDGNVPVTRSVTVKWFIGDFGNIRVASIFDSKNYYIALAEFGSDENNIIVQLDANRKWRIKRGLGVSTFNFFFNEIYFCSSTSDVVGKFLESFQDLGTDIEIDVRTRAFDFSEQFFGVSEFEKVPESFILEGKGTGATYDIAYSLDNGATFISFIDPLTGSTTFTTTNDDALFSRIFRVDAATNGFTGAKTIMYKVHTDDEYDIKIHRMKAAAFVTRKEPFITG